MKPTAISLFCGAGGCSLGFQQAGYNILYASDINPKAIATYRCNFSHVPTSIADIGALDFNAILQQVGIDCGEVDIVIGGPPCQGFSSAGRRFWQDPRNRLLKDYVESIRVIRPKWFLMENVEGLLTAHKGVYIYEVVKAFIELGYRIRVEKIYSQSFAVAQRRKRVLIVGNRLGLDYCLPEPITAIEGRIFRNSNVTLRDAIGGLPAPSFDKEKAIPYDKKAHDGFERYLRGTASMVVDHYASQQSKLQKARISSLQPGQTMKDLPPELQHKSFQRRAKRRVLDGTPTEKRGGSPSGLKRLIWEEPCLTITGAATRELIHPHQDRPLTLREAARIQTFPDDFQFSGSASEKIQQIGNAIPPKVAQICAEHIKNEYGFTKKKQTRGCLIGFQLTKAAAMSPALKRTEKLLLHLTPVRCEQQQLFVSEGKHD